VRTVRPPQEWPVRERADSQGAPGCWHLKPLCTPR
jgi:hypothetical protein